MKKAIYFIVIVLLIAELLILVYFSNLKLETSNTLISTKNDDSIPQELPIN